MKKVKSLLLMMVLFGASAIYANENNSIHFVTTKGEHEDKRIEKTVRTYIEGGDKQSVDLLTSVMHDNYRVVINDTKENVIKELDKSTYLDFIGKKAFGGESRKVEIESIEVSKGLNATVKLKMTSSTAIFYSQFSLCKTNDKWWVIHDLVVMEMK